jgi:Tfp pilus assembly protein PilF
MTAEIWNKMGIAYQMMFDARDGMRCYRQSLKLEPRNALVWNNLGTVYASLKQYGQAEKIYRKALKYDPHSALILKNLGTNLMAERKFEKGDAVYRQALAIDPHVFTVHASQTVENPGSVKERGAMNYYMSLSCARAGYAECALDYLRKSLNEGFATSKMVAAEGDFASLRDNTDFQQLLAGQRK